jgi:hypothetical protein
MTKARDLANASTALSAVSATELGYVDGVTSAIQTQLDAKLATATAATTYVANSLADAKGDIFVASADNTVTRLPVGNSGEQIVADSSTSTGLRYNPSVTAGKNAIINGGFDIWQRGTSFTNPGTAGAYNADRWCSYFNGTGTITQETSVKPDTSTYALKMTATQTLAASDNAIYQLVEQLQMEQFRGKAVTLSVKLAGTATLAPTIQLSYSTTANDSLFNTNVAISGSVISAPAINTSTFVTYAVSYTVPTTAKTLRIGINSQTMANTNVLYVAEAQLEIGSTATNFSKAGGTIQGELAACQRYYWLLGSGTSTQLFNGSYYTATQFDGVIQYPVTMRTAPTCISTSGTDYYVVASTADGCNSISIAAATNTTGLLFNNSQISNTQFRGGRMEINNAAGSVALSAEL